MNIHQGPELNAWPCPLLTDGLSVKLLNCFEFPSHHLGNGNIDTYYTALWRRLNEIMVINCLVST